MIKYLVFKVAFGEKKPASPPNAKISNADEKYDFGFLGLKKVVSNLCLIKNSTAKMQAFSPHYNLTFLICDKLKNDFCDKK